MEDSKDILVLTGENDEDLLPLVKASDKLSALIKCIEERKAGNTEFKEAERSTKERIAELNQELQAINLSNTDATYIDTSKLLVDKNGRIKEHLFTDGLHPNADGYKQVAKMLKKIFD